MQAGKRIAPAPIVIETVAPRPTAEPTFTPLPTATAAPLLVYVSGEVARPAVYELAPGSIIEDAMLAAGGATAAAELAGVNLALRLADGMHIHIPAKGEMGAIPVVSGGEASSSERGPAGPVNINTATAEELETLPGIGPATAGAIIEYREANGPFARIEEIMDVTGIGEAKYEQIRELITTDR
jgi:competence protein ComEA